MRKDTRLPESETELRDWLAEAWKDGWRARAALIGKPMGTIIDTRPKRLDAFLTSWDLPPMPKVPPTPVRDALLALQTEDPS